MRSDCEWYDLPAVYQASGLEFRLSYMYLDTLSRFFSYQTSNDQGGQFVYVQLSHQGELGVTLSEYD